MPRPVVDAIVSRVFTGGPNPANTDCWRVSPTAISLDLLDGIIFGEGQVIPYVLPADQDDFINLPAAVQIKGCGPAPGCRKAPSGACSPHPLGAPPAATMALTIPVVFPLKEHKPIPPIVYFTGVVPFSGSSHGILTSQGFR